MKTKNTFIPARKITCGLIFILIPIFIFSLSSCGLLFPVVTEAVTTSTSAGEKVEASDVQQETEETGASETTASSGEPQDTSDQIKVTKPLPDQVVESPIIIEGEARGTWFFEGCFPVMLLDSNRNAIARHFAQAQGEWMTEDFVPFNAQLEFENPETATGILVLEKDNPSGLAEYDAKFEIPVRFGSKKAKIVEDADPQKGEYFVYAILKSIDLSNNKITVEQLINEPNEKEISPEVILSKDCIVVKVILEMPDEIETVMEITLDSIGPGSEIGIIFKPDGTARAIIYQEIVQNS